MTMSTVLGLLFLMVLLALLCLLAGAALFFNCHPVKYDCGKVVGENQTKDDDAHVVHGTTIRGRQE